MSSTYTVTVDIDVANQTMTSSDPENVTVPTSNYEIVTFDGKSCIRSNASDYATFAFGKNIESFSCKIFLQSIVNFTLFVEVDSANNTKYSLVYNTYYCKWYNPDGATFDPNNDLVGTWVTVTYSNSNKTLTFDNGNTQLTRSLDNYLVDLSIGSFANRYNVYLTDLEFEVSIPSSKYLNSTGLSEVWTNTKNYISAQLLGKSDVGHTHSASDITSGLATVATSGSYNDLSNKPTIPSKTSDLTNDSGFLTSEIDSSGTGWVRFKSGLQICWGQARLSDSVCNWNFPKTFLENPGVTATIYYTGTNVNAYQRSIEINLITSTGTSIRSANHMFGSNSYIAGTDHFNAIAIGRWK